MRYFAAIVMAAIVLTPLKSTAWDRLCVMKSDSENTTQRAVWADVSWSYKGQKWHIDKAFCLAPRTGRNWASIQYKHVNLGPQVRFRFYTKERSDCGGRTLTWSQDAHDIPTRADRTYYVSYRSIYREENGHYSIDTHASH